MEGGKKEFADEVSRAQAAKKESTGEEEEGLSREEEKRASDESIGQTYLHVRFGEELIERERGEKSGEGKKKNSNLVSKT